MCTNFHGRRHSMSYKPLQSSRNSSGEIDKADDITRPTLKREASSIANESFRQSLPMSYRMNKIAGTTAEESKEIRPILQREGPSFSTGSSFRVRARRLSLECSVYSGDRSSHGPGHVPRINRRSSLGGLSGKGNICAPSSATETSPRTGPSRGSTIQGRRTPRRTSSGPAGATLLEYSSRQSVAAIASSSVVTKEAEKLSGS